MTDLFQDVLAQEPVNADQEPDAAHQEDQGPDAADQQVEDVLAQDPEDVDQEPDAAYHGEDHNVADLELDAVDQGPDAQQYSAR